MAAYDLSNTLIRVFRLFDSDENGDLDLDEFTSLVELVLVLSDNKNRPRERVEAISRAVYSRFLPPTQERVRLPEFLAAAATPAGEGNPFDCPFVRGQEGGQAPLGLSASLATFFSKQNYPKLCVRFPAIEPSYEYQRQPHEWNNWGRGLEARLTTGEARIPPLINVNLHIDGSIRCVKGVSKNATVAQLKVSLLSAHFMATVEGRRFVRAHGGSAEACFESFPLQNMQRVKQAN